MQADNTSTEHDTQDIDPRGTLRSLAWELYRKGESKKSVLAALREENKRFNPPLDDEAVRAIAVVSTANRVYIEMAQQAAHAEDIIEVALKQLSADSASIFEPEVIFALDTLRKLDPEGYEEYRTRLLDAGAVEEDIARYAPSGECEVILERGDTVQSKGFDWQWDGWLARGKLHLIAGAIETGKSTIALTFAATVTRGGPWPDGTMCTPGAVVVWSGEDGTADTVKPRFEAAGGDPTRLHIVRSIRNAQGDRPFDPATDIPALVEAVRKVPDVHLIEIDPVVSMMARHSNENIEVRRALQPLVQLAEDLGIAVLGISHFSKGTAGRDPIERVTGSLAFAALPRVVMMTAKVQDDPELRRFVRAKSNIGPSGGGWEYKIDIIGMPGSSGITIPTPKVQWCNALEGTARELLAVADAFGDHKKKSDSKEEEAIEYLKELLEDEEGPKPQKEIEVKAKHDGYAWVTIRKAKKALGIVSVKEGGHFGGGKQGWVWCLPESLKVAKAAQTQTVSTFNTPGEGSTFSRTAGVRQGGDCVYSRAFGRRPSFRRATLEPHT